MALQPTDYTVNERLQPGARGEVFQADLPGYRTVEDRINRTQNKLNVNAHDCLNIKYGFDTTLPVLFRYGFAIGYNQIVIPKGRIVAVDPHKDSVDFESQKQFNTLTLANGGAAVRLRQDGDLYKNGGGDTALVSSASQGKQLQHVGKGWVPVQGMDKAYTATSYRPFSDNSASATGTATFVSSDKALEDAGFKVDPVTGKVTDKTGKAVLNNVHVGNKPAGIIQRNEYTRDDDAFNGMMPGPVLTDAMIELPWFVFKDKAEENPWGSAYGAVFPGALMKSDENGRFVVSPLSFPDQVATMSLAEYECERQQVVGEIYSVNHELVPEGAAKWATWALEDRLKSDEFNPAVYAKTNRHGEDTVNASPFNSNGKDPGYPFERNYLNHDLHMLASVGRQDNYDPRMNVEYQYSDLGIPGLTDGKNAVVHKDVTFKPGVMRKADANVEYDPFYFRNIDINVENMQIQLGSDGFVDCKEGMVLGAGAFKITFASPQNGHVVIEVADRTLADKYLEKPVEVTFKYDTRGMAGVPTFMDWDGIAGSVKVLLTK